LNPECPIVIAGGGVGGLTAALALAQQGFSALVLERAPAFREVGAGLQLAPNASRILRDLGVLPGLEGLAVAPDAIRIRRGDSGADLARISLASAQKRWGAPYLAVHRADLLSALVERASREKRIEIRTDAALTGFIEDEQGVFVTYRESGATRRAKGSALIGADGLRSIVRKRLHSAPSDQPAFTGHTAWRTLIAAERLPEPMRRAVSNLWLGQRAHLVHYPVHGGALINVVALVEDLWRDDGQPDDSAFWDNEGDKKFVVNRFKSWNAEARGLIDAGENWLRWPLFDRPPITQWSRGRIALLGDAAHPMLPYLAQGAAQAIEDAAALAQAFAAQFPKGDLTPSGDPAEALLAYAQARAERAGKIQLASRKQAEIYHMAGAKALARDMVLRLMPNDMLLARQDWIYSA